MVIIMIIINRRYIILTLPLSLALAHDGADALEPLHEYHQWSLSVSVLLSSSIAVIIIIILSHSLSLALAHDGVINGNYQC